LKNENLLIGSDNPNEKYNHITKTFSKVVQKHAPLKQKVLRGNHAPFVNKEFRKEVYKKSRLKNRFWKNPTQENMQLFKRQRNKCVAIRKKCLKKYANETVQKGVVNNKTFWKFIKPFMTNKGSLTQNNIILTEGNNVIVNERELVETFNDHYVNIVEKTTGHKPTNIGNIDDGDTPINTILKHYKSHSSVLKINEISANFHDISFSQLTNEEMLKLCKSIDGKKSDRC